MSEDPTLFDTSPFVNTGNPPPKPPNFSVHCTHRWRLNFNSYDQLISECKWCFIERPIDLKRDRTELEDYAVVVTTDLNRHIKILEGY